MSDNDHLTLLHERELNSMTNTIAHKEISTAAAMAYCAEHELRLPQWLVAAASELLCDLLKREKAQKRGRGASHLARYRQGFWDIQRWDAVMEVRRIRDRVRSDEKIMKKYPPSFEKRRRQENEKWLEWFRHGTFACASMYLHGRSARVGADAIKASYRRVKRETGGPGDGKYLLFDEPFRRRLGLEELEERRPGRKRRHLYNLTP